MATSVPGVTPVHFTTAELVNGKPSAPALQRSGRLLLSDDPEAIVHGVAGRTYQDRIQGRARVFDYHLNDTQHTASGQAAPGVPLHIGAAFTAPAGGPSLHLYRNRNGAAVGGTDGQSYLGVAQRALAVWMESSDVDHYVATLRPGETYYLEQLVAPGEISVLVVDVVAVDAANGHAAPLLVTTYASPAPKPTYVTDPHEVPDLEAHHRPPRRGTFPYANLTGMLEIGRQDMPVVVSLGEPTSGGAVPPLAGEYAAGTDRLSGAETWNAGNYGVLYEWELRAPPPTPNSLPVAALLNPRGGTAAFVITQPDGVVRRSPAVHAPGEAWIAMSLAPGTTSRLRYGLPGAAPSPVWLVCATGY